jgi:O-acetyl-ADP-ribose deacetylase (regulator of RNase III)
VAFPSISTGVYRFPLEKAAPIAVGTIAVYLNAHPEIEQVRIVCFDARTKAAYDAALAALEAEA